MSINFDQHHGDLVRLVTALILEIDEDYRAFEDDDIPGMCLTVGTDDTLSCWSYQTGDNSFTGGAYGLPHWAVTYLYRDSDPKEIADEIADQWADSILQ